MEANFFPLGVDTGDAAALKYKKFASMCKASMTNAGLGNLQYFGSPIMVNSVCLGSFCLTDYDKELEFGEGTPNFAFMQRLAVRAGRASSCIFRRAVTLLISRPCTNTVTLGR